MTYLKRYSTKLVTPTFVLLFLLAFTIAYFIFAHEGFYWLDDYGYAKYAWELQNGSFSITQNSEVHPNNPLTHRAFIYGPVALSFMLFGLNIYAATLWPLLCTLGCLIIIYFLYRLNNPKVAVACMVLLGLYFHNLFLASYLFPDNILMFFAFAAVAILYRIHYFNLKNRLWFYALLFVTANFAAMLSKETVVYYVIFYCWLFLLDLIRKQNTAFWVWTIIFGTLFLTGYFGYYHYRTGNWLYRFFIIEQTNLRLQDGNYINASTWAIINRLTFGPISVFIGSGIMVPFVLALGLFRNFNFRNFLKLKQHEYFWLLLALLVILQYWFGSTSISYYTPITLKPRMFSIAMPPLCLAAAYAFVKFAGNDRKLAALYTILFFTVCLFDRSNTLFMYIPLTIYFGWNWWKLRNQDFKVSYHLGIVVLTAVLILRPLHFMRKPSLMSFQQQDRLIKSHLNRNSGNFLVIGDQWLEFMYDFHYKFEPNPHYTYVHYDTLITNPEKFTAIYLLVNRASLSNPDMAKLHPVQEPEINRLYPNKELIAQEDNVLLYRLNLN